MMNHGWRALRKEWGHNVDRISILERFWSTIITFIAVIIAWVFFRAETVNGAIDMLSAMLKVPTSSHDLDLNIIQSPDRAIAWTIVLLCITFFLPNTQEIMENKIVFPEFIRTKLEFIFLDRPDFSVYEILTNRKINYFWIGASIPLILLLVIIAESQAIKEFIYFNF